MNPNRLSICVPTYNFGAFIGETLESVIGQAGENVEVVVVDGASTDNTAEVVRDFQRRFPKLVSHRLPAKGGIDRDLATTMSLARGEYCWLLSSDDVVKNGAIDRVLREIASLEDIYLCNRVECDRDLTPLRMGPWLSPHVGDRSFRFESASSWVDYCGKAQSIGALFSYMSSIIVRRSAWDRASADEKFLGSNYAHVARLLNILQHGGRLKYIREALVDCRGGNDSFRGEGVIRRYLIDFKGYDLLASNLFQDSVVQRALRDVVRREHRWYWLTQVRHAARASGREWTDIDILLRSFGYPGWQLFLINALGSSRLVMGAAFPIRRAYKRVRSLVDRRRRPRRAGGKPAAPR